MELPELKNLTQNSFISTVFNDLEESVVIIGSDKSVQFVNNAALELFKVDESIVLDKNIEKVITTIPPLSSFLGKEPKKPLSNKIHLFVNGKQCLASIKVRKLGSNEKNLGFSIVLKDITEIEGFTAELNQSKVKYKTLFRNTMEGILIMDDTSSIVNVNPVACEVYGFSIEEFTKLKVADLFPHKSDEEASEIWDAFIANGELEDLYKYRLASGETKYISFKAKSNFIPGYHLGTFYDVTEQRKTELALRNSEAQLKSFFDSTSQRIFLIDLDLNIILANKNARNVIKKTLGREVQEGESIFNIIRPDSDFYIELSSYLERVMEGEQVIFENQPYEDTRDYWIEITLSPVYDNHEKITSICVSTIDISLRKKAELTLAESEARFRSLVQHSNDVIAVISKGDVIEYTSSSISKVLGYEDRELINTNFFDLVFEEDVAPLEGLLNEVKEQAGSNFSHEFRIRHAEGFYLYLETIFNNQSENPFISGILMSARDITERKFQEESLLLLERAIDSSENGIIITDPNQPDNPVIYANKAFEKMTGYNYLDIIGKNCRILQKSDNKQVGVKDIRKAVNERKGASVLIRNYKKDGTLFWNDLTISPVFNREKHLSNFIGVLNDVTERKVAEDTFYEIAQGIASTPENNFFEALVKHLTYSLHLDWVFVGEIKENSIVPKAYMQDGSLIHDLSIKIESTPWSKIAFEKKTVLSKDIAKDFPDSESCLQEFTNFLGIPLIASDGKVIGVIAAGNRKKFYNQPLTESLLNLFSVRTAAEVEREQYLNTLQKSESKFRMLAENSPDLIFIFDLFEEKVTYFNRESFFGYHCRELEEANKWLDLHHPDDVEEVYRHWKDIMDGKPVSDKIVDYRIRKKNGDYEWATTRVKVIEREGEVAKRVLVNLSVITERKKAEEALKQSEAKLTALIENTNDILFSIDNKKNFTTMNTAFRKFMKQSFHVDIEVGKSAVGILGKKELNDRWNELISTALQGDRFTHEFNLASIGEENSFEASFYPIYSEGKEISGVSVYARDITSRKNAELDIIRTNFELDSFVYRASHDLRAPLRSVLGLLNLLRTERSKELREGYIALANKSVSKLDTFISDLTDFSRNSRMEVNVSQVNFENIVDDAIERLRFMEKADKISIRKELHVSADFFSDPTRISIIIQNLVSNSIKYQNEYAGQSFCEIRVHAKKDSAKITISDNGRGIKKEYLGKIFNMFFRASQDSYGSGLGLYITKQVVEKLKGSISVKSEPGKGTSFEIEIPGLPNPDLE